MKKPRWFAVTLILCMLLTLFAGCATSGEPEEGREGQKEQGNQETQKEKNGEVYILFTSDVHCGIGQGFGYSGLMGLGYLCTIPQGLGIVGL